MIIYGAYTSLIICLIKIERLLFSFINIMIYENRKMVRHTQVERTSKYASNFFFFFECMQQETYSNAST